MLWGIAFNIALFGSCIYAWVFGKKPEKIGAAMVLIASNSTWIIKAISGINYGAGFMTPVFFVDILFLGALIWLSLRSNRHWPLWAAGFHLAGLITHLAVLTRGETPFMAYAHAVAVWSYAVLAALVIGTWLEASRNRGIPR